MPGPLAAAAPSIFIALLHFEGDAFKSSLIHAGERGGKQAAHDMHRLLREEGAEAGQGGEGVVYLVAEPRSTAFGRLTAHDEFLRGFTSSSAESSLVVWPSSGLTGSVERIQQLLSLFLPLPTTSRIYLGSLHTNFLSAFLSGLPPELRTKIVLLETVTFAPKIRELVEARLFKVSKAVKGLFGDLNTLSQGLAHARLDEEEEPGVPLESVPAFGGSPTQSNELHQRPSDPSTYHAWGSLSSPPSPRPASPVWSPPAEPQSPLWDVGASYDQPPSTSTPSLGPSQEIEQDRRKGRNGGRRRNGKERQKPEAAKVPPGLYPPAYAPPPAGTAFKPPRLTFPADNRPCNRYYLDPDGCRDYKCQYSHDFPFSPEEWRLYPLQVKSSICPTMKANGACGKGEKCTHGHRCPYTERQCPYEGKCHFKMAGLEHSKRA